MIRCTVGGSTSTTVAVNDGRGSLLQRGLVNDNLMECDKINTAAINFFPGGTITRDQEPLMFTDCKLSITSVLCVLSVCLWWYTMNSHHPWQLTICVSILKEMYRCWTFASVSITDLCQWLLPKFSANMHVGNLWSNYKQLKWALLIKQHQSWWIFRSRSQPDTVIMNMAINLDQTTFNKSTGYPIKFR